MGTTTDAHCFACGYDVETMIGGGRANFKMFAAWPVSCPRCEAVVTANSLEKPMKCLDCGCEAIALFVEVAGGEFEDSEWERLRELVHGKPAAVEDSDTARALEAISAAPGAANPQRRSPVESAGALSLWRGRYSCPKCGEAQLRFGTGCNGSSPLLWD